MSEHCSVSICPARGDTGESRTVSEHCPSPSAGPRRHGAWLHILLSSCQRPASPHQHTPHPLSRQRPLPSPSRSFHHSVTARHHRAASASLRAHLPPQPPISQPPPPLSRAHLPPHTPISQLPPPLSGHISRLPRLFLCLRRLSPGTSPASAAYFSASVGARPGAVGGDGDRRPPRTVADGGAAKRRAATAPDTARPPQTPPTQSRAVPSRRPGAHPPDKMRRLLRC